jgi:peptidylprolyl isomerase
MAALAAAFALAVAAQAPAPPPDWRRLDPEWALVIETTKGAVIVELVPEMAPKAVERMKQLAREGAYDGLQFHRVIDRFMAQTGNPNNKDGGKSAHPDLEPEFTFRRTPKTAMTVVARPNGSLVGYLGPMPIQSQPDRPPPRRQRKGDKPFDPSVTAWGLYCPGVVGMGRGDAENSANSEFFLMREAWPSLDKRYTPVGRVIIGLPTVRALKAGQPPSEPDTMVRVRVMADLPERQRLAVEVRDTRGPAFQSQVASQRRQKGANFSACDLTIDARVVAGR